MLTRAPIFLLVSSIGLALGGCCGPWEGELCGVMDPEEAVCPTPDEFSKLSGAQVLSEATTRFYVDAQTGAGFPRDSGALCCYTVRYTTCEGPLAE